MILIYSTDQTHYLTPNQTLKLTPGLLWVRSGLGFFFIFAPALGPLGVFYGFTKDLLTEVGSKACFYNQCLLSVSALDLLCSKSAWGLFGVSSGSIVDLKHALSGHRKQTPDLVGVCFLQGLVWSILYIPTFLKIDFKMSN